MTTQIAQESSGREDDLEPSLPKKRRLGGRDMKVDMAKPGIRFHENMAGDLFFNNQSHHCQLTLTIESRDVQNMIELDLEHSADICGTVLCSALSEHPLTIAEGHFQLMAKSADKVETRESVYKMVLRTKESKSYFMHGKKEVHKDSAFEMGMADTTELKVIVYAGTDTCDHGREVCEGKFFMTWREFMKQMVHLEVTNTESSLEKLRWKARFGKFYMGLLWDTYGLFTAASSPFDPEAAPREKRPLNLGGVEPKVFSFDAGDGVQLALTRFKGGTKGPLMLAHGMGVSSQIYWLDTIDKNFVEYLVKHEYDVWMLEWRASVRMDAHKYPHTLDSVAKHDMPTAVDRIIAETDANDIQVVAHCVGSIAFFMSMLAGHLEGKIRCIISSQVAFCTVPSTINKLKAHARVPSFLHGLGVQGLSAYTDKKAGLKSRAVNFATEVFTDATTSFDEHCDSDVCHRITFMYGLMWKHKNLNPQTHNTLHEIFGYGTATFFEHLSACMRKQYLVDERGDTEVYLPDYDKGPKSKLYMKHMKRLDLPILYYSGSENHAFPPEATLRAYDKCMEAFPKQDYRRMEFSGYGHLDQMMGKNVEEDIFEKLLPFLDQYAHPDATSEYSGSPV